jgi:hypothetical protein
MSALTTTSTTSTKSSSSSSSSGSGQLATQIFHAEPIGKENVRTSSRSSSGKGSMVTQYFAPPPADDSNADLTLELDNSLSLDANQPKKVRRQPAPPHVEQQSEQPVQLVEKQPLTPPFLKSAREHMKAMELGADERRSKVGEHLSQDKTRLQQELQQKRASNSLRSNKTKKYPTHYNIGDFLPDVDVMVYPTINSSSSSSSPLTWSTLLTQCQTTRLAVIEFYVTKTRTAFPVSAIDP